LPPQGHKALSPLFEQQDRAPRRFMRHERKRGRWICSAEAGGLLQRAAAANGGFRQESSAKTGFSAPTPRLT
jgi:hypothetical protein